MDRVRRSLDLDRVGSMASILCVIHCVLSGFVVSVLPVVGADLLQSTGAEVAFIGTAGLVGIFAIAKGYKRHRSLAPAVLYFLGLGVIVVGHIVFNSVAGPKEAIVSIVGGGTLIAFHILNSRLPKRCDCEYCQPDQK